MSYGENNPTDLLSCASLFQDRSLPNIKPDLLPAYGSGHEGAPRFLLLYGSLREGSFSRLLVEEAARLLLAMGGEVRIFDPRGLPVPGEVSEDHPKVQLLRDWALWSDGQVWCSPESHGMMSSVLKIQLDHLPLEMNGIYPVQGKTLALLQVCGGSQSFNTLNQMRIVGRWLRMLTIPNQSSLAKVWMEFDEKGRMKSSPQYDRLVDVIEELMKFTLLTRTHKETFADRYSERKAKVEQQENGQNANADSEVE